MRSVRWLLLILPGFVAVATANTLPPSLIWTADPITLSNASNTLDSQASALATDTGMEVKWRVRWRLQLLLELHFCAHVHRHVPWDFYCVRVPDRRYPDLQLPPRYVLSIGGCDGIIQRQRILG